MEVVNQIFSFLAKMLEWWFIVMPWEQAIFVRGRSKAKLLKSGTYFKIPFYDKVFVQTVRIRAIDSPIQTMSTKDGKTITLKSLVWYSIGDMFKLYNTLSHPEATLSGMVMGYISEYTQAKINADKYGLKDVSVKITSWAEVKTYRLIQDGSWVNETLIMDAIK